MKLHFAIVLSAALGIVPGVGSAFDAINGTQIVEAEAGTFEVLENSEGLDAGPFWCGAGDYVISELEEPDDTPIILIRPAGESAMQPGKRSVGFTIEPTDAQSAASVTETVPGIDTVGATMTAFAARDRCPAQ